MGFGRPCAEASMKLLKRHIEKDGSGSVGLRLEYDEDLWHGARASGKLMHLLRLELFMTSDS